METEPSEASYFQAKGGLMPLSRRAIWIGAALAIIAAIIVVLIVYSGGGGGGGGGGGY